MKIKNNAKGDCPECGDDSFTPSRLNGFVENLIKILTPYSPFRCSSCNKRFWASTGLSGYLSNALYVCLFTALVALLFSQKSFDDSSRLAISNSNESAKQMNSETGTAINEALALERELVLESKKSNQKSSIYSQALVEKPAVTAIKKSVTAENDFSKRKTKDDTEVTQKVVKADAASSKGASPAKTTVKSSVTNPVQPAAAKVASVKTRQQLRVDVLAQVENWRAAWENQDTARYLASYSIKFKPEKGFDIVKWRKKRKASLLRPSWIELSVRNSKTAFSNNNKRVTVRFLQKYSASNYADTERKELVLMLQGNNWNIIRERSL